MKENIIENVENNEQTKSRKFVSILKKVGKVFVIVLATVAIAVGSAFAFAGCTPKNNQTQITPAGPVTPTLTIQDVMNSNQANFNKFVNKVSGEIEDIYDSENTGDIIFMACDVNDKDKTEIDDLVFYTTVKDKGDERTFMQQTCTFESIKAQDIADDNIVLTDLTIESTDILHYNAYEKQNDQTFLKSVYEDDYDMIVKAYENERIEHPAQPSYEAQVTNIQTLISEYPTQAKALGDKVAKAILKKYNSQDAIFCGYSFDDANSEAEVSAMTVSVATKIDDTERKFATYKIMFDPVRLDDIANETCTLTNTRSGLSSQQTYNAKEKQNDTQFLSSLYAQDDFAYVAYQNEVFITMQELLSSYGDTVNANLATHYDSVLKQVFGRIYDSQKNYVTNYQWDLGEVNENDEIQHAKLTFLFEKNNSTSLYVYNVDFNTPIQLNDLKDASKISSTAATYSQKYIFGYDNSIQGTRTELVNAILDKAITDGFDYQNADIMFKENSASTDSQLGTVRSFTVVVSNNSGIKQINFSIQTADNDQSLINKINSGKFKVNDYLNSVEYSNNLLAEYDFEAEMN